MGKNEKRSNVVRKFEAPRLDVDEYADVVFVRAANKERIAAVKGEKIYGDWNFAAYAELGKIAFGICGALVEATGVHESDLVCTKFMDVNHRDLTAEIGYAILSRHKLSVESHNMILEYIEGVVGLSIDSDRPEKSVEHAPTETVAGSVIRFLQQEGGKMCKYPAWIEFDQKKAFVVGRFREAPPREAVPDLPLDLEAQIDGIVRKKRETYLLDRQGKTIAVLFAEELFLPELRSRVCDSGWYDIEFVQTTMPNGRVVNRLLRIGDQIPDAQGSLF